jgi:hypothetical protein
MRALRQTAVCAAGLQLSPRGGPRRIIRARARAPPHGPHAELDQQTVQRTKACNAAAADAIN